jgi:CRP/FNR family transcriptional regulator, dissimilatory nitrate respiration regulator
MEKLRRPAPSKADLLARCALFADLPAGQLLTLAPLASLRRYDRGELLFLQDTPAAGLHVVTRGQVEIYRAGGDGPRRLLHVFGPGEVIGEVPAFEGGPFPATAAAASPVVEALFLPRDEFHALGRERPEILLQMLATLSRRLRQFLGRIESLASQPASARLAARLLELSREQGQGGRPATAVSLPSSKANLAHTLGMTPETLSRLLRQWRERGMVRVERRLVRIERPEELRALAGP